MNKKVKINTSDLKMPAGFLKLPVELSSTGTTKEKSNVFVHPVDTADSYSLKSSPKKDKCSILPNDTSATVESLIPLKKKIWKHNLNSSEINTLTTKLSATLDLASTSKEKALTPFWTLQSKEISQKLWLPTKIDCVDSVLSSSQESFKPTPMGRSWFSTKEKHPLKKNSLMTSFRLSQFSLPDSMDSGATPLKNQLNNQLKTLKIRLFPDKVEKMKIHTTTDQFKWYYNSTNNIVTINYKKEDIVKKSKFSSYEIRDLVRKHEYVEEFRDENMVFMDFKYDEKRNEIPKPDWWNKVHSRIPRGASNKFVSSLNSAISNYRNGNIKHFKMKYMSKKNPTDYVHFEDEHFPSFIRKIKSNYWFTDRQGRRKRISFSDVDTKKRGIEIIYEKSTGKYFLHYPVERDWFPTEDRRSDNQARFVYRGRRVISLDPGVRKFLVGYDPRGKAIFIGEGAQEQLIKLLYRIDKTQGIQKRLLWKKIKNLVQELHWKAISFLIENYDVIILPDFRVSQMIRGKKLGKMTKRMMCMFSFFSFKEKLNYKCDVYKKKLIIVDESYTSCTCGRCGKINDVKGKETYNCDACGLEIDRDVGGARNIFIKNVSLR